MGSKSELKVEPVTSTKLLAQGKALFKAKELEKATEVLSQALQLRTQEYGELAIETAPYYYEYGRALLELCKATQSLLGNKGAQPPPPSEGDADDWEISWELLEASRVSYEKELAQKSTKEHKLALAEVYICLAECHREQERFPESSADFEKCLKIFEDVLEKGDRQIAYAHQEIASNCVYANQTDKARYHYECVRSVLDTRICSQYAQLQKLAESKLPEKPSGKMVKSQAKDDARIAAVNNACNGIEKFIAEIRDLTACRDQVAEQIAGLTEVSSTSGSNKENEDTLSKLASRMPSSKATSSGSGQVTIGFGESSTSNDAVPVNKLGTFGTAKTKKAPVATVVATKKRPSESSTSKPAVQKKAKV
uniref:Tetratricopeptide SHNi-TPR domain-containing protein n=1 Tax=Lotharella oceanica TaxID=641309 RepID=A0A7S2TNP9_9EUKA